MAFAVCSRVPLKCFAVAPSSLHPGNTVPVTHCPLWQIAFALVVPALLWGCVGGDDCNYGEVQCDGNAARSCVTGDRYSYWQVQDCGTKTCVVAANRMHSSVVFCALSAEPDTRCLEADVPNCASDTLVDCTAGYATSSRPCATGCLALDDYPDRCAGEPDQATGPQRCGPDGYVCTMESGGTYAAAFSSGSSPSGVCSEGTLMSSTAGYVIYNQSCEGGSIVARARCAQSCALLVDCSTTCR